MKKNLTTTQLLPQTQQPPLPTTPSVESFKSKIFPISTSSTSTTLTTSIIPSTQEKERIVDIKQQPIEELNQIETKKRGQKRVRESNESRSNQSTNQIQMISELGSTESLMRSRLRNRKKSSQQTEALEDISIITSEIEEEVNKDEEKEEKQKESNQYLNIWDFIDSSMSSLRRKEYLSWLKLLQLNQNLLFFGIGFKAPIIEEFAKTMLIDEDIIEFSSIKNKNSTSSSTSSSFQRKKSGEEVLWELFQCIRQNILKLTNGMSGNKIPSSSIWSFHSDGNTFPLEFEAQLISGLHK